MDSNLFTPEEYKENFKKNKKGKKEERVQLQICKYIKLKYPHVIFFCDLASGMRLPIWMGALHKQMRSSRGLPDLFIAYPKHVTVGNETFTFHGLFIELKREGVTVKLRNGELPADEHIREQAAILEKLRRLGYGSAFACGYNEAIKIIDEYLC
jgi:hypothetical protein